MEAMRESWTDDRLDHLNHRVEEGFKHVEERVGRFEKHVGERLNQVEAVVGERLDHAERRADERFRNLTWRHDESDRRMARLESGFDRMDQNFTELNRVMVKFVYAVVGTMFAGFMAVLAAVL
jgi:hypothetical protein